MIPDKGTGYKFIPKYCSEKHCASVISRLAERAAADKEILFLEKQIPLLLYLQFWKLQKLQFCKDEGDIGLKSLMSIVDLLTEKRI